LRIYTSYFARLSKIDVDKVPIAICAKVPTWYSGLNYKRLAPSYDILTEFNDTQNEKTYKERFYSEILSRLNRSEVFDDLEMLSRGKDVVLVGYENPSSPRHRHIAYEWLTGDNIMNEI